MEAPSSLASRILSPREVATGSPAGAALENINTATVADGAICFVRNGPVRGNFKLDKSSTLTPDWVNVIAPISGPGRWRSCRPLVFEDASTSYTPTFEDENNMREFTTNSSGTLILPVDATFAAPVGYIANFAQDGTGQWTTQGDGTSVVEFPKEGGVDRNKSRDQGAVWSAMKVGVNTWRVFGDLST